ncbi:MAG: hypothetical protein WEF50_13455 [Myxococcota bacterium]
MRSLLLLALATAPVVTELPEHLVADPRAPVVTEATLLENERFWPYQTALTADGSLGVLIRVEQGGLARLDFGRDGKRTIPVSDTDLVVRANQIRTGLLEKAAPNFVLALGPRLVDSGSDELRPYPFATVAEKPGFVCVFADPGQAEFASIVAALSPLHERHGLATILFPQGEHPDPALREKLRALKWTVPFVYDHLSESYTRSLLKDGVKVPAVVLLTREGRVLLERAWSPDVTAELSAALDVAFAATTASAPGAAGH